MDQNPIFQALEHFKAGRLEPAAEQCRAILLRLPDDTATNHLLGVIYFRQGKTAAARDLLAFASASADATAEIHNNYGAVLNALGSHEAAIAAFKRALALQSGYADAHNNLGVIYRAQGQTGEAIDTLRRAIALKPELAEAKTNLRSVYRDVVPGWHFAMMGDRPRNDAYEAAINRVAPGRRVLDIGTGSGLLAMMAARAGAKQVTTCEAVKLIAERAREIIALNGLSDRITVVDRRSSELVTGVGITERAEVLVTEVFSSGLIHEGVLPTVEHAHQHLLTRNAIVIPAAASAMGYLVGGPVVESMLFVGNTNGFDLSPFNDFAPPTLAVVLDAVPHEVLSDDFELLRFEMKSTTYPMGSRPLNVMATRAGVCAGIAQWIKLELDEQNRYENRPSSLGDANGHWTHILYRFPKLVPVKPGDMLRLVVRHDRKQISIDLVE
ncbi:MAG TPA: tetratricopeptide repeat protein [Micropepsaceae bacterium]|nr:tetratricopeptide repeat protein [Micropepsaceae bacterium]